MNTITPEKTMPIPLPEGYELPQPEQRDSELVAKMSLFGLSELSHEVANSLWVEFSIKRNKEQNPQLKEQYRYLAAFFYDLNRNGFFYVEKEQMKTIITTYSPLLRKLLNVK